MENRQLRLVIIDTDNDYLKTIEEDIIKKYSAAVSIQVITDPAYVEAYFSEHQTIDLLLIDEESYGDFLKDHDIRRTFVMAREISVDKSYPDNVTVLLKYIPKEEIIRKMDEALFSTAQDEEENGQEQKRRTKLVAVYSPIGGCGKSLACIALAGKLKKLDQKVLLVSADPVQSMSVFFPDKPVASEAFAEKLKNPDEDTYWTILQNIGQNDVSYVLPFEQAPLALGITWKEMYVLLDTLMQKNDFDFIIVDIGTILNQEMAEYLSKADSMILLTETNEIAARKMQKLLKNPDLLPKCNCILVANEYRSDGSRIARGTVFGSIAPYQTWREVLDDPVFYRIALKISE